MLSVVTRPAEARTAARAATASVRAIATAPAAAGLKRLGKGGAAGAVVGAFTVGYAIGTGLRKLWARYSPEERAFRRAVAFREARRQFETQNGRPPEPDETKEIARAFGVGVRS